MRQYWNFPHVIWNSDFTNRFLLSAINSCGLLHWQNWEKMQSLCRLTGLQMPQRTVKKSRAITHCRTGMPQVVTRQVFNSFWWTTTTHHTMRDPIWHTWFNTMWTECCPGLPSFLIWSVLKIFGAILNSRRNGVLLPIALMYIIYIYIYIYIYRERERDRERERERERETDRQTDMTRKRSGISYNADCCGQYAPWGIITSCARWEDISETKMSIP